MIDFRSVLDPGCTRTNVHAASRKSALEQAAQLIAGQNPDVDARLLLRELLARERLGSTGLGDGVAVPHCRMQCERPLAAFLRLAQPIDFDAPDERRVDLVFTLVVPRDAAQVHLDILSVLVSVLNEPANQIRLRRAQDDPELFREMMAMLDGAAAA
ncbi:MAG: PTS sugar transporter subunit IIA [Gammaproteobacteria bacterium]|nr:PTS sugar transporter subunit IIA [Gammaproteobacteria bacterium]